MDVPLPSGSALTTRLRDAESIAERQWRIRFGVLRMTRSQICAKPYAWI